MFEKLRQIFKREKKDEKKEENLNEFDDDFWIHLERIEETEKKKHAWKWTKLKVGVLTVEILLMIYLILALLGMVPYF